MRKESRYSNTTKMKTHCKRNHELTPQNTYTDVRGYLVCRTCRSEQMEVAKRITERLMEHREDPAPAETITYSPSMLGMSENGL